MTKQVIFLKAANNREKLEAIVSICQKHFLNRDHLLIHMQDKTAAEYLDQLLWRTPEESFLPHCLTAHDSKEPLVITTIPRNLNHATILFNLCSKPSTLAHEFNLIYELMDTTTLEKQTASEERLNAYKQMGTCTIL